MRILANAVGCLIFSFSAALGMQPLVAVHDSEFTRTLLTTPASAPTPITGATGFEWWSTNWGYFVMPESAQEAFRSDGTPFATVSDANITAGSLIDTDGTPKYPIVFSLASEAIGDDEIAPLTNYVAAGGFLFVGSSSFTRNTNGTTRNNFAFATELGMDMTVSGLTNWRAVTNFQKFTPHRLVSHVPEGRVGWFMPFSAGDIPYGRAPANALNPSNSINFKHLIWQVTPTTATVIASNDVSADLLIKQYGKGYFIYYAPMQPLIGHGGVDSGMHAYMIFRKAVEWAFEASRLALPRLSPWPYPYDAAVEVRHDLEAVPGLINLCETSAQYEKSIGLKGDYYPCTGPVRDDYSAPARAAEIASLQRAVTNYGATLGSHNGGLTNAYTTSAPTDYWYWHWSPDETLDAIIPGFPNGKSYAFVSISNSFNDIRGWLSGITNNARNHWVAPAYNSSREDSKEILEGLCITAGEDKLTFFPHWTLSTKTSGRHFSFLSIPLSDWYVGSVVSHSIEGGHTVDTLHNLIDFYYQQGGLINQYSHASSAGGPPPADALWARNDLAKAYCDYAADTNRFPRMWPVNAENLFDWWTSRTMAKVTPSSTTNGLEYRTFLSVSNATDPQMAVEVWVPRPGYTNIQVFTNLVAADTNSYRTVGQLIRVLTGTIVTNVEVRFTVTPAAQNDLYSFGAASPLTVSAPGILTNDTVGFGTNLSALLVAGPSHGTLSFAGDGGFTYTITNGFIGLDSFTYRAVDGVSTGAVTTVTLAAVTHSGLQYMEDFSRGGYPAALGVPWTTSNNWVIVDGELRSTNGPTDYGFAYIGANWTNYSVEARIQFPATANVPGAAIMGRLNPSTGARYALWLYPDNTPFGTPNILRLIKFTGWTTWSGTPMGEVNVTSASFPSVGTNWHTLKLSFTNNQISASYEGSTLFTVTDNNFSSVPAYLNGGIGLENYRYPTGFVMSADNVIVSEGDAFAPLALGDRYQFLAGRTATVSAPGVLVNDVTGEGGGEVAQLVSGPLHHDGAFTLNPDGSFTYTPTNGYVGPDSFTYQVFDGLFASVTATVNVTVLGATNLVFFDNFTRTNLFTGLLAPWGATNQWSVTNGQLSSLSNTVAAQNYAFAVIDTNLTDFSVQASISFPSTQSGGGGLGGRLNVNTGARYSVWLYPDGSPFGVPHSLTLFKWTDWTTFVPLGTANLPALGLGGHTLKLTFETNRISVHFDGSLVLSTNDNSFANGGVDVETYEDPTHFAMLTDYLLVSRLTAPILPTQDDVSIAELTTLVITNTASETDLPTYLLTAPAGASIDTAGVITWTPDESQGPSTNTFTTVVTDGAFSTTNSITVIVTEVNVAPTLPAQDDATIAELSTLTVTNTASDVDLPANILTYELTGPSGASIDTNGVITWIPGESQGPSTNTFTTIVSDGEFNATNSFVVIVTEVNVAPTLPEQTDATIAEQTTLVVTNMASDSDLPANTLTYELTGPSGASISTNGIITWIPNESQGPGTNTFTIVVSDGEFNATNSFVVTVTEVNTPPTLPEQSDVTIAELTTLTITNTASDADLPANMLTYELTGPSGASIDTNGVITWIPDESQGPGTNTFTTVVTDGEFSATNSFVVTVTEVNVAPTLPEQSDVTIAELTTLTITNTASDTDLPANTLTYELTGPSGASIDTNGVITWIPDESQGPSTNTFTTVVSDGEVSATNSFVVTVTEVNEPPTLPEQSDVTIAELTTLTVTNTASDLDLPANPLTYELTGPSGASIDTNGVIIWTPDESQGPGTNTFTTVVSDGEFSTTNSFVVIVTEVNVAPTLPEQTDATIAEQTTLVVTNTASDADLPANTLTYELTGPSGASIDTNGVITWTPDESQGPGTNTFTTVVSDGEFSATNSFVVTVTEVNVAPTLPEQSDVTIAELITLTVTNTASDGDLPANTLTYQLTGPSGASISTNGIITWTPTDFQGPSTNTFTTVASDGGLSDTNSFLVVVTALPNIPPAIKFVNVASQLLTVTFESETGRTYRMQYTDDLKTMVWVNVVPDVLASGTTSFQTNAVNGIFQRYYRVLLLSP